MKRIMTFAATCLAGYALATAALADGKNAIWGTDGAGITNPTITTRTTTVKPMDPEKQTLKQTQQQLEGQPAIVDPGAPIEGTKAMSGGGRGWGRGRE